MSTIEDFENAPVGATASRHSGWRALKTDDDGRSWTTTEGSYFDDVDISQRGYTLDPVPPATAREALDLAWDLAHEVKEGQVILKGTQYLVLHSSGLTEFTAHVDFEIWPGLVLIIRTLEPLPDPEPDWLDAPAILASHPLCADTERIGIWLPSLYKDGMWELPIQQGEFRVHWYELENVTPLYPKEGQDR